MMPDKALRTAASVRRIGTVLLALLAGTAVLAAPAVASGHAQFTTAQQTVEQGETVTIPLNVSSGDSATIDVASQTGSFAATATVTDNGTGTVQVTLDTGNLSADNPQLSASGGDLTDVTVERAPTNGTLPVGEYLLQTGDNETAVLTVYPSVELDDGNILTLSGAPGQNITGTADLEAGEEITVRLRSSAPNPFLESETVTVTENGTFDAVVDLSGIDRETTPDLEVIYNGTTVERATVEVTHVAGESESDSQNDDSQVAINVESLELDAAENQTIHGLTEISPGETVNITLSSTGETPFRVTDQTTVTDESSRQNEFRGMVDLGHVPANTSFTVSVRHDGTVVGTTEGVINVTRQQDTSGSVDGEETGTSEPLTLAYEGERLELEASGNQTIRGTGDIAADDTVNIRLRGSSDNPFLLTEQAEADNHGNFRATVNMSAIDVQPGTEFEVRAVATDGQEQLETTGSGVVVAADDKNNGTATDSANLDAGGEKSPLTESDVLSGAGLVGFAVVLALVGIGLLVRAGRVPRPN